MLTVPASASPSSSTLFEAHVRAAKPCRSAFLVGLRGGPLTYLPIFDARCSAYTSFSSSDRTARSRTRATFSSSSDVVQREDVKQRAAVAKTSTDGAVGSPIDFETASKILGNESQIAIIELEPGQILRAEAGAMMYMTDGVEMSTTTGGGLSAGFQRMLTGQNFFISDYTYNGPEGTKGVVALGTDFPSKILRLNVDECGGKIVCQKGALLCASHTVNVEMEFTKNFKSGFFGGEGFVLQALTGEGDVFVKAGGTLIRRDLKESETLRASAGCLVAFVDADYGTIRFVLVLLRSSSILPDVSHAFPLAFIIVAR
jgi:uncharacterized protein (TIGR00266 family)